MLIYQETHLRNSILLSLPFKRKTIVVFICAAILNCCLTVQVNAQVKKREFRAVWVATVANIDWPSRPGLSSADQQAEVIQILDRHKENGMNAIILQVRPVADALYDSSLEPWSAYLTGEQGKAPVPFYDPLKYWVDHAHARGMELHAWFNPYRVKQSVDQALDSTHIAVTHPEWTVDYGNKTYFNPAIPAVREFVTEVVTDVVRRYDIDAVHFDDYFYPYQVADVSFPDDSAFAACGGPYYPDHIEAWRRHNVDTIIQMLSEAIKEEKPWVKFGISPFGVWRNRAEDPAGSETLAGTTNYDNLYADVIMWQQQGWIDYLMPQIYWRDDHPAADFSTLAYWWNDAASGRHLYVGLAPYRIQRRSEHRLWRTERRFLKQMDVLRSLDEINGFGMFSSSHFFRKDLARLNRLLQRRYTEYPAIVPAMPWIDNVPPDYPSNLRIQGNQLTWDTTMVSCVFDQPRFFVVYRFDRKDDRHLKSAKNIFAVTGCHTFDFGEKIPHGIYRVAALDRLGNESQLSDPLVVE